MDMKQYKWYIENGREDEMREICRKEDEVRKIQFEERQKFVVPIYALIVIISLLLTAVIGGN